MAASTHYYLSQVPLRPEVALVPLGFALNAPSAHRPSAGSFTAAHSTDYSEIGLGVGGMVGVAGPLISGANGAAGLEDNTGSTFNQVLRLGPLDGLNLLWQSSVLSRPNQFVFGTGRGELNVPLTQRLGLFGSGGAGENGWAFGELSVRSYLRGEGGAGTRLLSASLGYAAILDGWDASAQKQDFVGGPSVAFGMEWRRCSWSSVRRDSSEGRSARCWTEGHRCERSLGVLPTLRRAPGCSC